MQRLELKPEEKKKAKRFIGISLLLLISTGINYLLVYELSYTPMGYEVVAKSEESITIQTYDVFNMEDSRYDTTFSGNKTWRIESLTDSVERHNFSLFLLFMCITISSTLFIKHRKEGLTLWKAFWESHADSFIPPLGQAATISSNIMDIIA